MKHNFDNFDKAVVEALYTKNGIMAVSAYTNIKSTATLYKLLSYFEITKNRGINKEQLISKVPENLLRKKYYDENCSIRSCAKYFGITHGQMNSLLHWYNFEPKTQAQRNKTRTNTDIAKYGVSHSSKAAEIIAKGMQTKKIRYNDCFYTNRLKSKATCLEKYGAENVMQVKAFKDKSQQTMLSKYGVKAYPQAYDYHKKARKHYKYNDLFFDSQPELALYIFAEKNKIEIKRLPLRLTYVFNNKKHYYYPDFLYNGMLVELKNDYLLSKMQVAGTLDSAKYNCMLENNVVIWTSKDYKFALDFVKQQQINLRQYKV